MPDLRARILAALERRFPTNRRYHAREAAAEIAALVSDALDEVTDLEDLDAFQRSLQEEPGESYTMPPSHSVGTRT